MLASDNWKPDDKGFYFIDRDPKYFRTILEYLRTGELDIDWTEKNVIGLKKEFDYFQLKFQEQLLHRYWSHEYCSNNITLNADQTIATKSGGNGWNSAVLCAISKPKYKVKIINRVNGDFMIGLASKRINVNGTNYSSNGWYVHGGKGQLYSQFGDTGRHYYGNALNNNDTVEVKFDKTNKNISFTINGTDRGIAFTNVNMSGEDLYPCLEFFEQNVQVQIIE